MANNRAFPLLNYSLLNYTIMNKKITISQDDYRRIQNALRVAASFVDEKQVEINWYADAIENLEFAWRYGQIVD